MTKTIKASGGCLCGATRFTAHTTQVHMGACHCKMCRQWASGPYLAVECGSDVVFENTDKLAVYESSAWAERGFCKQCGSHLFYRFKDTNNHMMAAGTFDDESAFILDHQVFIDNKPHYYSFAEKTHNMTEAESMAEYASTPPESKD